MKTRDQLSGLSAPVRTWAPTTAVLGAGHGGMALAADLARRGVPVHLWNRTPGRLRSVHEQGGIWIEATDLDFACPQRVSADLGDTVTDAEVILVAVPASAHGEIAVRLAPHLRDGHVVLLLPGRTGGALEFSARLQATGCSARILLGEAQTFPFASRVNSPGEVCIHRRKLRVMTAALPAHRTPDLLAATQPLLPELTPAESVLSTSLENVGAVLHPVISLLNAGRIEDEAGAFAFYTNGVTPAVARVLAALDQERVAVGAAYGVRARSLLQWLRDSYATGSRDLVTSLRSCPAYAGINAPATLDHRYIWEDVPTGLVPLAAMGRHAGVTVATMDGLVAMASAVHSRCYAAEGRSLAGLGLLDLSVDEIISFVHEGGVLV